jgi:hypothetical protein
MRSTRRSFFRANVGLMYVGTVLILQDVNEVVVGPKDPKSQDPMGSSQHLEFKSRERLSIDQIIWR